MMASGGMHLTKDFARIVTLLPVKDVPESHTLACSKMHPQHQSYITEPAPSLFPFLASFLSPVFRSDTAHAVQCLFLHGTSPAS